MTHIELSLSPLEHAPSADPLAAWIITVAAAEESCLVIDRHGIVAATSPSFPSLLHQDHDLVGRHLSDPDVLPLIDFTAAGNELGAAERDQIPPLLALTSGRPARGLMRLRGPAGSGPRTLDAIATALHHRGLIIGSLSFFATV